MQTGISRHPREGGDPDLDSRFHGDDKTVKALRSLIRWGSYLVVAGTPVFYLSKGVYPYILSKTAFFQAAVELVFFAWLALRWVHGSRAKLRITPLSVTLVVFLGILLVTSALGIDFTRSFWSTQERASGIFLFLHLAAFALVIADPLASLNWKKLLHLSEGTAAFVSALALIQLRNPYLLLQEAVGNRPGATFGNPTFLAGYLLFHIILGLYMLADCYRNDDTHAPARRGAGAKAIFLVTTIVLSAIALFTAQTRGDILGLGVAFGALAALSAFFPPQVASRILRDRRIYAGITLALIALAGVFWYTKDNVFWRGVPGLSRFQGVSLTDSGLQPRLIALRSAWKGFLDRPLTGWGWENYNIVFNKYYDPRSLELNYQETRFDKPHNLFAEYLVTGGAPFLAAFFALLGAILYSAWKGRDRLFAVFTTAAVIGYAVRSAFVFDTLGPMLMLFVLMGIADREYRSIPPSNAPAGAGRPASASGGRREERRKNMGGGSRVIPIALLCASFIPIYWINIATMEATYYQYYGFKYFISNKPSQAIRSFKEAVSLWNPYQWALARDYAIAISEAYFYNQDIIPKEEVRLAIKGAEEVARAHPEDAYNHYVLVDMYNQVSDIDPEYFLPAAEREAARALELSPDRQEVYFSLSKTKSLKQDYPAALAILKRTIDINPKIPDAHFYYGLIAFADEKPELGYAEIKTAIALGRKWKNQNEPRVVANFFANAGHIDEAIELYQASLAMKEDKETRIKLGIAYFFVGERDLARENISVAIKGFDITTSRSYEDLLPILRELEIR